MNRQVKRWLGYLLCAAPALIPLGLIRSFGVNFPFWDQWEPDIAGVYVKSHQGTLGLADFFAQHYEHRILVPRIIWYLLAQISGGNTIWEMICGWVIVAITSAGVLALIRRTVRSHDPENLHSAKRISQMQTWLLCNIMLFIPAQWENFLWGMGVANLLPMMLIVWGIVAIISGMAIGWQLAVAAGCCTLATWSSGHGLVSWPLLAGAMLAFSPAAQRRGKILIVSTLVLAFAVNAVLYFVGYRAPGHAGTDAYGGSILSMLQFYLAFLGNAFAFTTPYRPVLVAQLCGTFMLLLLLAGGGYALFLRMRKGDRNVSGPIFAWALIAGFSLLTALLGAATRSGFSAERALQSRYVSFSLYLPLALIPMTAILAGDLRSRLRHNPFYTVWTQRIPAVLGTLLLGLYVLGCWAALNSSQGWSYSRERGKGAVMLSQILPANPELVEHITSSSKYVLDFAPILSEAGYLRPPLIRDANAALIQASPTDNRSVMGNFDKLAKQDEQHLVCTGWAVFPGTSRPALAVFVTCTNSRGEPIILGAGSQDVQRPDIAAQFGNDRYSWAGWTVTIPVSALPQDVREFGFHAWALDTTTGKAHLLPGAFVMNR